MSRDEAARARSDGQDIRMTRRGVLKAAGAGAASMMAGPYVACAGRQDPAQGRERVLGEADARIEKCRKGSASLRLVAPGGEALPPDVRVRIEQTRHKFLFGCNIFKLGRCRTAENNAAYAEQFARLLNFATLPFYWWTYERWQGRPDDERTDEIVRWCKAHDITTKGHPLAWNYVDPLWLTGTPEEIMRLQCERVGRCVERFKGDIGVWDVVNEATHYDREQLQRQAPKLTAAITETGVGEYVRMAFKTARAANPRATLLINDYRTDAAYVDKVIRELVDEEGKPLYDVIGIQSHMHGRYWGAAQAWDVCERFARFGKPLHFTETTVVSGPRQGSMWRTTPEGEQEQANQVSEFYTVLFSHPAVEAITWWDFTDQGAWQRAPAGLVRDDMSPKPVYERLHDLIRDRWRTAVEATTGPDGRVAFRGFLGQYEVKATVGTQWVTGRFALDEDGQSSLNVRLS